MTLPLTKSRSDLVEGRDRAKMGAMRMTTMLLVLLAVGCGRARRVAVSAPDFAASSDLGAVDQATADLAGADLAGVDLASSDLSAPDLAHHADLAMAPDMALAVCGGTTCAPGYACAQDGMTCVVCGDAGEPCCPGYACSALNLNCRVYGMGEPGATPQAGSFNVCRSCGQQDEGCCDHSTKCYGAQLQCLGNNLCE